MLVLLALLAGPCNAAQFPDLLREPAAMDGMRWMVRESRYGFSTEQAAFLVREPNGGLSLVRWPESGQHLDHAFWEGSFPTGTVAILHTHPTWQPQPSNTDRATSRTCGVPIYVLTATTISRATCGASETVVRGQW